MVSWKRWASCDTTPTVLRSESRVTSRRSCPAMRTLPAVGSYSRDTRCVAVVLPTPDGPTRAVSLPDGTVKLTSCSTSGVSLARSSAGSAFDSRDARETSLAGG
ncbi:hypothetical protein SRIMM317S_04867 [Streptomyces rimosus subsp. rimosus]